MADGSTTAPEVGVDVIIAVHNVARPIARAVRSVLDGNSEGVRLTVVCHNVSAKEIRPLLDAHHRDRVRYLEHTDSHRSASGPFNAGIDAATAPYISIMGSDDVLLPGAVASWYWLAERSGADAVIARLEIGTGKAVVRTPPTRLGRVRNLDGVRDRLCYRSAPLGLVSRRVIARLGLRLEEGAPVGGDVAFVTRLWFGATVAFDRGGPAYVIGEDAKDRVTYAPRPITVELGFLRRLLRQQWFGALSLEQRRAACAKYLRIHLFGAVHNRLDPQFWTLEERAALAEMARALREAAPGVESVLSLADTRLLNAIDNPSSPVQRLLDLAVARRRHGHPATIFTRDPMRLFAREAPIRLMAASLLVR